jgi:hypothetical protein
MVEAFFSIFYAIGVGVGDLVNKKKLAGIYKGFE